MSAVEARSGCHHHISQRSSHSWTSHSPAPLKYIGVNPRNFSCPAVSHILNRHTPCAEATSFWVKLAPIVGCECSSNVPAWKRSTRLVFPTLQKVGMKDGGYCTINHSVSKIDWLAMHALHRSVKDQPRPRIVPPSVRFAARHKVVSLAIKKHIQTQFQVKITL